MALAVMAPSVKLEELLKNMSNSGLATWLQDSGHGASAVIVEAHSTWDGARCSVLGPAVMVSVLQADTRATR